MRPKTKDFAERLWALRDQCQRCWAEEFADIFPRVINEKIAAREMDLRGNPAHTLQPLCRDRLSIRPTIKIKPYG